MSRIVKFHTKLIEKRDKILNVPFLSRLPYFKNKLKLIDMYLDRMWTHSSNYSINYKLIHNFELNTPLGRDFCTVEIMDDCQYTCLKPGEETRIRKKQILLHLKWLIENNKELTKDELDYILIWIE